MENNTPSAEIEDEAQQLCLELTKSLKGSYQRGETAYPIILDPRTVARFITRSNRKAVNDERRICGCARCRVLLEQG